MFNMIFINITGMCWWLAEPLLKVHPLLKVYLYFKYSAKNTNSSSLFQVEQMYEICFTTFCLIVNCLFSNMLWLSCFHIASSTFIWWISTMYRVRSWSLMNSCAAHVIKSAKFQHRSQSWLCPKYETSIQLGLLIQHNDNHIELLLHFR